MWEIYSILDWQWWVSLFYFVLANICSWYIPGLVVLSYTSISKKVQFYAAPIVGMSFWAVESYILGWLNLRILLYGCVVGYVIWLYFRRKNIFPLEWKLQLPVVVWIILVLGVLLQMIPVWGSGWRTSDGIAFYFVNVYDGLFHMSLARSLIDHFPPIQPGAIGMPVTNYHYLSNLVTAELTTIWRLPLIHLHFQFLPLFMSIWLGLFVVLILKRWSKYSWTIAIGLVLFYGVGELTWLINLLVGNLSTVPFEVFIDHGMIQFLNPPQAFAKIVFFCLILLFQSFWLKRDWKLAAIIGLMTSTLIGFKVYFGLAAGVGITAGVITLLIQWLIKYIRSHQLPSKSQILFSFFPFIVLAVISISIGAAIYLPANANAGGLFFDFLTWPKLLLGVQKLNWQDWWLRLQVYEAAGNTKAIIFLYAVAAGTFLTAIYHVRLAGIFILFPKFRQKIAAPELAFCLVPAVLFTLIGMNFLQSSGGPNSFNFMVVAISILNFMAAVVLGKLAQTKWLAFVIVLTLGVVFTQTVFVSENFLNDYKNKTDSKFISAKEEEGLKFLSQLPKESTVLQSYPGNLLDSSTPYFYYFTGQFSYYGGRGTLVSHNQPINERKANLEKIFISSPASSARLADSLGITHLVLIKHYGIETEFYEDALLSATDSAKSRWTQVYANDEVRVLSPIVVEEDEL